MHRHKPGDTALPSLRETFTKAGLEGKEGAVGLAREGGPCEALLGQARMMPSLTRGPAHLTVVHIAVRVVTKECA